MRGRPKKEGIQVRYKLSPYAKTKLEYIALKKSCTMTKVVEAAITKEYCAMVDKEQRKEDNIERNPC